MGSYTRIERADQLMLTENEQVTSPELYLAHHTMQLVNNRRPVMRWTCVKSVDSFVEHGRWIAKCLNCKSGMLTHPEWQVACCGECGAVYRTVNFPTNWKDIEKLLLARPVRETQNWLLDETIEDLQDQNQEHLFEIEHFNELIGGDY